MKIVLITLIVLFACCWTIEGHAGIIEPRPRGELFCNKTSLKQYCGEGGSPCGPGNILKKGPFKKLETEDKFTVRVWQRMAHHHTDAGSNYYAINFWDAAGNVYQLAKEQQTNVKDNVILKWDVKVPKEAVKGPALVQVIFNATTRDGGAFYSCADIDVTDSAMTLAIPFALLAGLVSLLSFGL